MVHKETREIMDQQDLKEKWDIKGRKVVEDQQD